MNQVQSKPLKTLSIIELYEKRQLLINTINQLKKSNSLQQEEKLALTNTILSWVDIEIEDKTREFIYGCIKKLCDEKFFDVVCEIQDGIITLKCTTNQKQKLLYINYINNHNFKPHNFWQLSINKIYCEEDVYQWLKAKIKTLNSLSTSLPI